MGFKTDVAIAGAIIIVLGLIVVGIHYAFWRDNMHTEVRTKTSDGYDIRVRLSDIYAPDMDDIDEDEINKFDLIMDRMKYIIYDYTLHDLMHNTSEVDKDIEESYLNYGSGGNSEIDIEIEKIWWNGNGTSAGLDFSKLDYFSLRSVIRDVTGDSTLQFNSRTEMLKFVNFVSGGRV